MSITNYPSNIDHMTESSSNGDLLKGGRSDLGTKFFYKNTKKNHPYTPKTF